MEDDERFAVCSTTPQGRAHYQTPMLLHSISETPTTKPKRRRMEEHVEEHYMSPTGELLSISDYAMRTKALIGDVVLV